MPGGITAEKLNEWKAKYDQIHMVSAEKQGRKVTCYLRPPDLKVVKRMMNLFRTDLVGAGEIAINSLWLGGDQCIKEPSGSAEEMLRAAVALEAISVLDIPATTSEIIKN